MQDEKINVTVLFTYTVLTGMLNIKIHLNNSQIGKSKIRQLIKLLVILLIQRLGSLAHGSAKLKAKMGLEEVSGF